MNTTISCASLEQPGKWRIVGVVLVLLVVTLPALPLLWHTTTTIDAITWPVSGTFGGVLGNSVLVALTVAAVSLLFGLPVGVLVTFYEFRGRRILLALATLPLLVPSVLWAIGWSAFVARLAPTATDIVSGITGCALVFSMTTIPLVLLTSYAATMGLSGSQVDSARLAGGELRVFWYAARHAAIPALLAALLGGVLTLSDPGPGQILGLRTAASEILISFSALYDFTLAAQQCVALTVLVLIFAAPLAYFAGSRIASGMLAQQTRNLRRVRHKTMATLAIVVLTAFVLVGVMTPILGLTLPLRLDGEMFRRALSELGRTAGDTVLYATGAGAIAVLLGFLLTFFVGRQVRLKTVTLGAAFALFSLPPALTSLGLIYLGTDAPAWADPLFRSRLTVCLALGLRFFPVAAILSMRAWNSASTSWALAAGIHGVPLITYLRRVALPLVLPTGAVAMLLIALLATADIGTVLLLHPPGAGSFPLAIFTVMANAPESLVAALCLLYVVVSGGLVALVWVGGNSL